MKSFLKNVINLLLILVLIYSGYNIFIKLRDYHKANIAYGELQDLHQDKKSTENETIDFSSINSDYQFWINIENTNINYPVVQGSDNSFYLYRDFNKEKLGSGSIFMDYRNEFKDDRNTILYGHNMKNKTMFSALEKFKSKDFFNEGNKIVIEDKDYKYTYEVFSAYFTDANFNYLSTSFSSDDDFLSYINTIKNKSLHSSNLNVFSNDKIITLSTCSYERNNTRTVVHGKLVSKQLKNL